MLQPAAIARVERTIVFERVASTLAQPPMIEFEADGLSWTAQLSEKSTEQAASDGKAESKDSGREVWITLRLKEDEPHTVFASGTFSILDSEGDAQFEARLPWSHFRKLEHFWEVYLCSRAELDALVADTLTLDVELFVFPRVT
mgnify:CR=1 FL=1